MRYLLGLMILAFAGGGLLLLVEFGRELLTRLAACSRLLRVEGEVVDVVQKLAPRSSGQVRASSAYMFLPVVRFTPDGREPVTFKSEVGDGGRDISQSRYRVGQRIGVRYDPLRKFPPMLESWSGLWLPPVIGLFAGLVFLGGAAMAGVVYRDKVLGR